MSLPHHARKESHFFRLPTVKLREKIMCICPIVPETRLWYIHTVHLRQCVTPTLTDALTHPPQHEGEAVSMSVYLSSLYDALIPQLTMYANRFIWYLSPFPYTYLYQLVHEWGYQGMFTNLYALFQSVLMRGENTNFGKPSRGIEVNY